MDPLFSDDLTPPNDHGDPHQQGYLLPRSHGQSLEPDEGGEPNRAANLIRHKLDAIFAGEPNSREELAEAKAAPVPRSKHQQFMYDLSTSGKSLAEIQTAWHNYYVGLPDAQKHEVWQEFYAANERHPSAYTRFVKQQEVAKAASHDAAEGVTHAVIGPHASAPPLHEHHAGPTDKRDFATVKKQVLQRVRASHSAQVKAKQHLKSLAFGISIGSLVLLVFLFSFFNEVVITPFIRPGAHASATPIILDTNAVAPSDTPQVIIPKINAQLPVVYDNQSVVESDVETALEQGVVHYPTTFMPGQQGNAAFFGHSSNNIFNKGKYKFAFVLLHEMEPGDLFYLTYNGKVYTYKIFKKQVVEPTDTWVLNNVAGKSATATLITCDPPGTSLHRLVVWGEQISPSPDSNVAAPAPAATGTPRTLPSNGPSLWSRFWSWL